MNKRKLLKQAITELTKELTNQGKLIEAGFATFRYYVMAKDAPSLQVDEMCLAFMAGAEHLFSSIINILDPGEDPTEADLDRLSLIDKELNEWRAKLSERVDPAQGRA